MHGVRNPQFYALLDEIRTLHDTKSHDYTPEADPLNNLRRSEAYGIPAWKGVLVRLTDKWSRIEQLAGGKVPKHESLRDSLIDNAVYSLLAVLLLDERTASDILRTGTISAPECEGMREIPHGDGGFGWTLPPSAKMGPK